MKRLSHTRERICCLPWDVSGHFCNPRSLLCKRRHSFLLSLHLKAWERASQIVARGLGSQSTSHHFQDLLALGKGKDDLEAAKEEEARTTASLSCSVSQVCLDIVAPAFHSPKELNPSSSTSLPRDPMSRGRTQCCVQNRTYECVAAPGNFNVRLPTHPTTQRSPPPPPSVTTAVVGD
mmetsp:Transcript_51840/g.135231  ORF Transcript_51840/g.135231 Transcript_51840/m.135231 type:complete len:178 (+) Transcript_51840:999-1532(+)